MWQWIKSLFAKPETFVRKDDFNIYQTGGTWGDRITFFDFESGRKVQRIFGWKSWPDTIPEEGDLLIAEMKSGKNAVFAITDIERKSDPPDMFFANAHFLGYENEVDL